MYQKDFILRMIEMLGELLAGILGLIRKGEYQRASENLERIYFDMLKQDATFFRDIPGEQLTVRLLKDHNYTSGHLEILANLFAMEAELCLTRGNMKGCYEYSGKSLILFEFIDRETKTYSADRQEMIRRLRIAHSDDPDKASIF